MRSKTNRLPRVLGFRASKDETDRIDELAKLAGLSRSDYLRSIVVKAIWTPSINITVTAPDITVPHAVRKAILSSLGSARATIT